MSRQVWNGQYRVVSGLTARYVLPGNAVLGPRRIAPIAEARAATRGFFGNLRPTLPSYVRQEPCELRPSVVFMP
jgi:hypothetical protein